MIKHIFLTNLAANVVKDMMLDSDQGASNIRFVGRPSSVTFALTANAATVEYEVYTGGRVQVERSGIDASGTAGQAPKLNEKGQQFFAAAGDILEFRVRETGGVATTDLQMSIDVTALE